MATEKITALLKALHDAQDALVAEIDRQFPEGSQVLARTQTNHPPQRVIVIGASIGHLAGRLAIRFPSGHRTSVHCSDVVGHA